MTHDITLTAFRALTDEAGEATFQDLLEAVSSDFRSGDRTLGGLVNTLSIPSFGPISEGLFGGSVAAHESEASFRIEEVES